MRYLTCAWVCIRALRRVGCALPIELWHLGDREMDDQMKQLLRPLGVECINARKVRKRFPVRSLRGWEIKPYAILHSQFREVMLLDADNVPVANPDYLFETPEYLATGAIFWPDYCRPTHEKAKTIWRSIGVRPPKEHEFETGQIVVDKRRCWAALCLTMWLNENSDFYYRYVYGDKETFHLAFQKLRKSYALVNTPIHRLEATMCQHDFNGRRLFQHRNCDKWTLDLNNRRIKGFWHEDQCREDVIELQRLRNGAGERQKAGLNLPALAAPGAPGVEISARQSSRRFELQQTDCGV